MLVVVSLIWFCTRSLRVWFLHYLRNLIDTIYKNTIPIVSVFSMTLAQLGLGLSSETLKNKIWESSTPHLIGSSMKIITTQWMFTTLHPDPLANVIDAA